MAINFNALPDESGFKALELEGKYKATIVDAKMKTSKAGAPYLNARYTIFDKTGKKLGSVFDMQFESDKPFLQYKLKQFIKGFQLGITGEFELADLPKICINKSAIVELTVQDDEGYGKRTVINTMADEPYAPMEKETAEEEATKIFAEEIEEDVIF